MTIQRVVSRCNALALTLLVGAALMLTGCDSGLTGPSYTSTPSDVGTLMSTNGSNLDNDSFRDRTIVANWGRDDATCSAVDAQGTTLMIGRLTRVATVITTTKISCNGNWLLSPPDRAVRMDIQCDRSAGSDGQLAVTPSGKANFHCSFD